jgi:hypothetical protein
MPEKLLHDIEAFSTRHKPAGVGVSAGIVETPQNPNRELGRTSLCPAAHKPVVPEQGGLAATGTKLIGWRPVAQPQRIGLPGQVQDQAAIQRDLSRGLALGQRNVSMTLLHPAYGPPAQADTTMGTRTVKANRYMMVFPDT